MIRSMTGFGRGESFDEVRKFTVEIKTLNHRYSDIIVRMPKHFNYLDEKIKKIIRSKVTRGRVEIYVGFENIGESDVDVKANLSLARSYKDALENLANDLNIVNDISLDILSKFPEVLNLEKKEVDEDEVWKCLKSALEEALEKMIAMRVTEGEELIKDINEHCNTIMDVLSKIEERSPEIVEEHKKKLHTRIEELLEGKYEIDENILANEVAFFADKSNINEEIVRLNSHINQLLKTLESDISVGRKLDFLVQEMNREINTIGSKVSDVKITNNVVEIKSELEKIREQIQNIE